MTHLQNYATGLLKLIQLDFLVNVAMAEYEAGEMTKL
jgi:hypothetical protein